LFRKTLRMSKLAVTDEEVDGIFSYIDVDSSGGISKDELFEFFRKIQKLSTTGKKEAAPTPVFDDTECQNRLREKDDLLKAMQEERNRLILEHQEEIDSLNAAHEVKLKELQDKLDSLLKNTQDELKNTRDELTATQDELERTKEELKKTQDELASTKDELYATKEELKNTQEELAETEYELSKTKDLLASTIDQLRTLQAKEIEGITSAKNKLDVDLGDAEQSLQSGKDNLEGLWKELLKHKEDGTAHDKTIGEVRTDYDEDLYIAPDSPIERSQTIPPPRRLVTLQRAWFPLDAGHDWSNPLIISVELGDCEPQFSSAKRVLSNEGATIGAIEYNEPFSFTVDMGDEDFDSSSLQIEVYDETDPQNELGCASVRCHPCLKATYADIYDYNGNELCKFLVAFS